MMQKIYDIDDHESVSYALDYLQDNIDEMNVGRLQKRFMKSSLQLLQDSMECGETLPFERQYIVDMYNDACDHQYEKYVKQVTRHQVTCPVCGVSETIPHETTLIAAIGWCMQMERDCPAKHKMVRELVES